MTSVQLRDLGTKKTGVELFGELQNVVLEENGEDKWSEKVTNQKVIGRVGEKRTLLNNILRRKANWIVHIPRGNCVPRDAIEGQMTVVNGVGRKRTQVLDDLRNRRCWELEEEAEDRISWKQQFNNRT